MKKQKKSKAGILTKLVLVAVIVSAAISLMHLRDEIQEASAKNDEYAETVGELTASNAEKEYEIEHSEDEETIEDIARDLGYVLPGETVFIDAEG